MSEQEAIGQINTILDQVYSLDKTPTDGINAISKVVSDITAD